MKVLIVHNDYGKYSGEEAVVDKMAKMLQEKGHKVVQLRKTTANDRGNLKGKIKGFLSGFHSPQGVRDMAEILDREKPDVVNVHNLYPFISPAALRECKKRGIPVVMTVHNYRLCCPTGLFMRNNEPCELCLQKGNEWNCIKHNCEKSFFKSAGYAGRNAVARIKRHYYDCTDVFACLTEFQKQKLIEAGFDPNKITVIPNSINPLATVDIREGGYVAYSGRLSQEKGIDLIMEAARRNPDIPFKIAGSVTDGDNETPEKLSELKNIEYKGFLTGEELEDFYKKASFFVMASRCYEGFPMAILEAGSYNKPMIAPDHGGFSEIIMGDDENSVSGLLFEPGNADSLNKAVEKLWNNPDLTRELGENARRKVETRYSTDKVALRWEGLFNSLIK